MVYLPHAFGIGTSTDAAPRSIAFGNKYRKSRMPWNQDEISSEVILVGLRIIILEK